MAQPGIISHLASPPETIDPATQTHLTAACWPTAINTTVFGHPCWAALVANNVNVSNFQQSFRLLSTDFIKEIETFWRENRHLEAEARAKILESFCPQVTVIDCL